MKKQECMDAMPMLLDGWIKGQKQSDDTEHNSDFQSFYTWLGSNHPEHINFRSVAGAEYDIELWFDEQSNITWMR